MDILFYVLLALFVFFMIKGMVPVKGVRQISTGDLKKELNDRNNKQFVDVRTPGEYKANHIRQFKNIPLQQLGVKAGELDPDKEVVVICQSGMRSQKAAAVLKKKGFKHVTNVQGGMSSWK